MSELLASDTELGRDRGRGSIFMRQFRRLLPPYGGVYIKMRKTKRHSLGKTREN